MYLLTLGCLTNSLKQNYYKREKKLNALETGVHEYDTYIPQGFVVSFSYS